ncbi:hypothetical protein SKAU_G00162850 [Synaphobranchus kaupii]|uniref:Uncharacterized protein n=1 Tax=Synaphobranchus kaupii TaxID=118154 RepID=A0A9Q1IZX9_SYNKA|nr:hypothetical protein SKAU_G00162850 [Synaphobranchus kaupii]
MNALHKGTEGEQVCPLIPGMDAPNPTGTKQCMQRRIMGAEMKARRVSTRRPPSEIKTTKEKGTKNPGCREHTQARLSESSCVQQLKDDITQEKSEFCLAIKELRAEITELQQDDQVLRAQLAKTKAAEGEGLRQRAAGPEAAAPGTRYNPLLHKHRHTPYSPPPKTLSSPLTLTHSLCQPYQSTLTLPHYLSHRRVRHTVQTPLLFPTDTQPPSNTQSPSSNRAEKPTPQVVLHMHSNGKFLEAKKLFPGQEVQAIRCSNTGRAMELLGNPSCIVVHTVTNDLCNM